MNLNKELVLSIISGVAGFLACVVICYELFLIAEVNNENGFDERSTNWVIVMLWSVSTCIIGLAFGAWNLINICNDLFIESFTVAEAKKNKIYEAK